MSEQPPEDTVEEPTPQPAPEDYTTTEPPQTYQTAEEGTEVQAAPVTEPDPDDGEFIYQVVYPDGEVRLAHSRTFADNFEEV